MEIIDTLKRMGAKRIFVQYPEGLQLKIQEIARKLEMSEFEVILSLEPAYGACDIRDVEAERFDCDTILHIGHTDFGIKSEIPVVYWDYFLVVDPIPILEKEFRKLGRFKKIGLVTTVQFIKAMKKTQEYLKGKDKEVLLHKTLKYPGQILGCNVEAATGIEDMVDCFLYVGAGKFHPLGVALKVKKPVLSLDLEKKEIYDLANEKMKWLKRKAWHEAKLKDAKKIGIIISWKKGQSKIRKAMKLKKELEGKNKEVYILAFDRIMKEKIEGLKFDCLINLACPRLDEEFIVS
jgi:2-(3-amino-3-carboxypropyl)histidine synthase